jgi:hypothetical protein
LTDELGRWEPLPLPAVAALLAPLDVPWWIAGGWAIDLFVGRQTRQHHDVDVGLLRRDQAVLHHTLAGWELHCADPPGQLRPWPVGESLPVGIHDIWARPSPSSPWQVQFMLNESEGDDWVYRRNAAVRMPLVVAVRRSADGLPYLAPEIQLLFKARSSAPRPRDAADLALARPLLDRAARSWLDAAIQLP